MNISSINNNNDNLKPMKTQSQKNDNSIDSIFLSFNDDNGIVEKSDIILANEETKKIATPLLTFLDKYCDGNHKWTSALSNTVKMFIKHFNESLENYNKDSNVENSEQGVMVTDKNGKMKFLANLDHNKNLKRVQYYTSDGKNGNMNVQYNNNIIKDYSDQTQTYNIEEDEVNIEESTQISFREDGTILKKLHHAKNIAEESYYDDSEKLTLNTTENEKTFIKERYGENNSCKETYDIKHYGFHKEKEITSRVIYDSENNELIRTDYENKKVVNFVDNRKDKPVFDKTKLNGKFDNPIKQGVSGVCYIVGIVNSMILSNNKDNLETLNKCVSYDKEKGIGTVTLKGLNKTYSFSASEIEKHMSRLGTEDPDFSLLALGYEQFLLEDDGDNIDHEIEAQKKNAKDERQRQAVKMLSEIPPKSKTIDGGSPSDFYFAITGKKMTQESLSEESFNKAKASLNNNGIVNACTISSNINDEFANNHNYSVLKIDDNNITLYEPNEGKEIICSVEKFKQRFAGIFYN